MKYRNRKLFTSSLRRAVRWEFWPMPFFYTPIVFYIVWLCLRYRGLTFLSCNPGLPMSGLIGEKKAHSLSQLMRQESPFVARFRVIEVNAPAQERVAQADAFMQDYGLSFPVVLKPDFGQRGQGVEVIRDAQQLERYLADIRYDTLIQEHVVGEEFGVFYLRHPDQVKGRIFSITEKTFPVLIGDGQRSLQTLIFDHPRTHYMARYLLDLHHDILDKVLADGERFQTVEIGSHCRGSVFLDASHLITSELTNCIDEVSQSIEGYYFGRYDIRVKDAASLQQGNHLKILEVNGVTSESTNIYDPEHSVFTAYKILFSQWQQAFEIGRKNIDLNAEKVSIRQFFSHLRATYETQH